MLVGNKSDLVHEREVATEEGQRLADEWGVPFLESSAKFNMNVEEVFKRLIAQTEAGHDNGKGDKNCTVS